MIEFLSFLKQYSEAITIVFSALVTLSTLVYAVLTWLLVSETRKMREVQTEPKIYITIENLDFAMQIIRLNIQNIGLGPASDLEFKPSVISGGESAENLLQEFTKSNFFKTGLRHFGPGQKIYSNFSITTQDYDGKLASVLVFKLNYKSSTGKKYSEEIILDMSELKGRYQLGKPNMYAIAQSLEKIQKDIHHIVTGFKRVKADVYSREDRKAEKEDDDKFFAEQQEQHKNS